MNKICVQKAAILNLAAILDFGTETEMVPNLDVFLEYQDLPLCQFSQIFLNLNNCLVLSHQSAALLVILEPLRNVTQGYQRQKGKG